MNKVPEKARLRAEMRILREEAAARDPDAGERLADAFPMKLLERYGPDVAGYVAIGSEIDPEPLLQKLAMAGAELSLPRVDPDNTISFRRWSFGEPLEEGAFSLREPSGDAPLASPTLVLTPLLAFDRAGNRLGYGKGHYDRAITGLRQTGRVFACALAHGAQMLDELPAEAHDQPLDWAVTPDGSIPLFMMRNPGTSAGPRGDAG